MRCAGPRIRRSDEHHDDKRSCKLDWPISAPACMDRGLATKRETHFNLHKVALAYIILAFGRPRRRNRESGTTDLAVKGSNASKTNG